MTDLRIARNLRLPLELAVEATAVIGKRGRGKTFTSKRIVEEVIRAGVTVLIIDPTDVWWGLRSGADGTEGGGLDLYVFGGKHADLPVREGSGPVLARAVLDGTSMVLCPKGLPKAARRRLVGECLTYLYDHADGTPILVVIDEADEYAPEGARSIGGGGGNRQQDPLMLSIGAVEDIVRRGRAGGLGSLLITQRVAVLAKSVLEQSDTLIALGVTGKNDIDAVAGWISKHAPDVETGKRITSSLPALPTGTAWVWSPEHGVLEQAEILPIRTFDSSRTPKVGEVRIEPKGRKPIDLAALGAEMEKFAEQVKADDPRELRKQIAELQRHRCPEPAVVQPERVEVPVLDDEARGLAAAAIERWDRAYSELAEARDHFRAIFEGAVALAEAATQTPVTGRPSGPPPPTRPARQARTEVAPARPAAPTPASVGERRPAGDGSLGKGERVILTAIAQYPAGVTREQLTVLTGYKRSSRDTYVQRLRTAGLVDTSGSLILPTGAAFDVLGDDFEPLPTGAALRAYWLERLSGGENAILAVLLDHYPRAVARDVLSDMTGYKRSSRDTYLQRLRSRQLVTTDGDPRAADVLFESA